MSGAWLLTPKSWKSTLQPVPDREKVVDTKFLGAFDHQQVSAVQVGRYFSSLLGVKSQEVLS